jgi:hypothetical protein
MSREALKGSFRKCATEYVEVLVRHKPTAYGRATLGAKPFRRAPK